MNRVTLVDTSMWVQLLRHAGDPVLKVKLSELIRADEAAWCDAIRLELWRGARSPLDRNTLTRMEVELNRLPVDDHCWDLACNLADAGRKVGLQFPLPDLLIFACAKRHEVPLLHCDAHFDRLDTLWPANRDDDSTE